MENRDDFKWRPNDNSVQTKMRYELEAKHWSDALKSASTRSTASLSSTLGVVGLIVSLVVNLVLFIMICIVDVISFTVKLFR